MRYGITRLATFLVLGGILLLAALLVAKYSTNPSRPDLSAAPPDTLARQIGELRRQGSYEQALQKAVGRRDILRRDASTKPWRLADAERQVARLRRIAGLPTHLQQELAEADSISSLLAQLYQEGNYDAGIVLVKRQGEIRKRHLAYDDPEVVEHLRTLALFLRGRGDYAAAEPLYHEYLARIVNMVGREHPDVAGCLEEHALLLYDQGERGEAEALHKKAIAIQRRLSSSDSDYEALARMLRGLGSSLRDQSNERKRQEAELAYNESFEIYRRLYGENHPYVAGVLHSLGILFARQRDFRRAEEYLRRAAGICRQHLGLHHMRTAQAIHDLADCLYKKGDFAAAERLFREVLPIRQKLRGKDHPYLIGTFKFLASCARERGDYAAAESLSLESARIYEKARLRAGHGFERAMFYDTPYGHLGAAKLMTGDLDGAWETFQRDRGRALADLLIASGRVPLSRSERARQDSLKKAVSELEGYETSLEAACSTDSSEEILQRLNESYVQMHAAEAAWTTFQQELANKYPIELGEPFPLGRIQRSLSPNDAIAGWIYEALRKDRYTAWGYVVRDTGSVKWVRLDQDLWVYEETTPADDVAALEVALNAVAAWPGRTATTADVAQYAHEVWKHWFAPLEPYLAGANYVAIVPRIPMLRIPIEALIDSAGAFLVERYAFSYTPSATLHAWMSEQRASRARTSGLTKALLLGDPPFCAAHLLAMRTEEEGKMPIAGGDSEAGLELSGSIARSVLAGDKDALASLPRLPWSRVEVESLAQVFPQPVCLLGPAASERSLVQRSTSGELDSFDVIHLATHAFVDDAVPGRSALVLSQVGLPDPDQSTANGTRLTDGLLTAKEIWREWQLTACLVSLSGCQTGLGKKALGGGYIGLATAVLQTGARSVLVSFWRVDDQATALLMQRFYRNLLGGGSSGDPGQGKRLPSKAEALQEAKIWLRNYTDENGDQPFRHPVYWSGFVLLGES